MDKYKHWGMGIGIALMSIATVAGCGDASTSVDGSANSTTKATASNSTDRVSNTDSSTSPVTKVDNSTSAASNQTTSRDNSVSMENTTASDPSNSSTGTEFGSTVRQAMQYVQKQQVTAPLMAPTEPVFSPDTPYIGAQVSVDPGKNSYSVSLFATDRLLPINSPDLNTATYESADRIIGSFGAVTYPPSMSAKSELYLSPAQSIAPAYIVPPKATKSNVDLGNGVIGTEYTSGSSTTYSPMVLWHEGDWTFEVWDGTMDEDVRLAKQDVAYLNTALLPETYGVFGENVAGDGEHTTVEWEYGNTLYSDFNYGSGVMALQMAVSSRVYPGGQIKS
ncbi:hypothetical protein [Alicyclobacillus fastidiosus]|uniref:Lipoprotein n=1 Tax=Alicyclobacillus fastidiosus TaxID=392011 RepID=A0ABV5A8U0_9BACL|nr:hypothetical protein [Alicyclobacillus fastidiosus]WEH10654.1 hypothetical protein PYS47_05365 [Alicyclobacillus fastidiosus]